MRKIIGILGLVGLGCSLLPTLPQPDNAGVQSVKIVGVKPQGCQFVAGILGDQDGGDPGHFIWMEKVTQEMREHLQNNAARLGGNVVYLRSAYMGKPDESTDYYQDFYINDIQYSALVYKCP